MEILNLYAGIGGNRKLWSDEHEITAVEFDKDIAAIYKDLYPNDNVIVTDAHQYLLEHYKEFDFIWSSPPCQSHSIVNHFLNAQGVIRYPDMKLYEEILLLTYLYEGKFVIENVKSYYTPLVKPQISGRHYFWANFNIPNLSNHIEKQIGSFGPTKKGRTENTYLHKLGFNLDKYKYKDKNKLLKNCVNPKIGLAIFERALGVFKAKNVEQNTLF
tara:strand:- start:21 stop:665 length:645 start_codon:yes stop_codon:yes gene_type:complete